MPSLHRYFGTPFTTWILNRLYGTRFSDIHCGMRGITKEAFSRMNLESQSWQYASEMVLKAAKLRMKISEVPIRFYKDREGRQSHHKRSGWFSPWYAGWINLKAMLLYTPDYFFLKPGILLTALGLILSFLGTAQFDFGPFGFRLHWMLFGICLTLVGYNAAQIGILGKIWHGYEPGFESRAKRIFSYNKGILYACILEIGGFVLLLPSLYDYLRNGFMLSHIHYFGILGLHFLILGFQTFGFVLLFELLTSRKERLR